MRRKFICEKLVVATIVAILFFALSGATISSAHAQGQSLLTNVNGDGQVRVLAFGDSITYGVGDNTAPGVEVQVSDRTDGKEGYPARIQKYAGIPVENAGNPGEQLVDGGVDRLPSAIITSDANVVLLYEGNNDAFNHITQGAYSTGLQRSVNVIKLLGKTPVLATLYPTCCNHEVEDGDIAPLDKAVRDTASANNITYVDISHAWTTTCNSLSDCFLLNLPEGLHPNTAGYNVIAQTILATLSGIDIFAPNGASDLENAYHLAPGTVIVKPDPIS